ncbi:hypothetical protein GOB57_22070 [Sinorhizobium meliloti]|nr:hypothetical protein [Sinorhizobium meliloti]
MIGPDQHDLANGWPIIRCKDGVLRLAMTPSSELDGVIRSMDLLAEVPAVLPSGFVVPSEKRYEIDINLDGLKDRLPPIDLSPSPPETLLSSK